MIRKFIFIGLLLLLIGAIAGKWVLDEKRTEQKQAAYYRSKHNSEMSEHLKQYKQWQQMPPEQRLQLPLGFDKCGSAKTDEQFQQEQRERLKADIDELAAGEMDAYPYAGVLYGENWRSEVNKYIEQKERREFVFTCSIVLMSLGGAIFICCFLIWITRCIIRGLSLLKRFVAGVFVKSSKNKPLAKADIKKDEQDLPPIRSGVPLTQLLGLNDISPTNKSLMLNTGCSILSEHRGTNIENQDLASKSVAGLETLSKNAIQFTGSLRSQVENLEKKVEEIRQITGDSQEKFEILNSKFEIPASPEKSGPLHDTLMDLTQQVAAIRQYASNQQDRIQKYQEGYDLNIIKNFCLRIIRCIDNVESCIGTQSEHDSEAIHLKELRDEMLFALESSGVEQFEPLINSDYRGQERLAEAVKEKEQCDDPNLTGKIARVVKPGYQYFIDEGNVKVVRPAMVKLFG